MKAYISVTLQILSDNTVLSGKNEPGNNR